MSNSRLVEVINEVTYLLKGTLSAFLATVTLYAHEIVNFISLPILNAFSISDDGSIRENITFITLILVCLGALINAFVIGITRSTKKLEKEKAKEDLEKSKIDLELKKLELEKARKENDLADLLSLVHMYQENVKRLKDKYAAHKEMPKEYYDGLQDLQKKFNIDNLLDEEV